MKLVSWNCKGLGGSIKVEALKNLLKSEKPDILLIQETKIPEDEVMNRSYLFWKNSVGKVTSSKGASGGIATFCRSNKFNIIPAKENTHWILIDIQNNSNQYSIFICNVYGPTHYRDKLEFGIPCSL